MRSDLSADMAVKWRLPEPTQSSSAEIAPNVKRGFPVFVEAALLWTPNQMLNGRSASASAGVSVK